MSLEELLHEEITPINVLGSHTHLNGVWMLGYRYMYMEMEHNQSGTRDVSDEEVLSRYPVAHTSMSMEMHMAEVMYAPSDYLTLMAMMPYEENSMHHLTTTGERPIARSSRIAIAIARAACSTYTRDSFQSAKPSSSGMNSPLFMSSKRGRMQWKGSPGP